jgi:hypothetical protein
MRPWVVRRGKFDAAIQRAPVPSRKARDDSKSATLQEYLTTNGSGLERWRVECSLFFCCSIHLRRRESRTEQGVRARVCCRFAAETANGHRNREKPEQGNNVSHCAAESKNEAGTGGPGMEDEPMIDITPTGETLGAIVAGIAAPPEAAGVAPDLPHAPGHRRHGALREPRLCDPHQ